MYREAVRVLLATTGSTGDVQPFFALGRRLLAAGHEVRLAASDNFAVRSEALGVPFVAVGPPFDPEQINRAFVRILAERNPMRQLALVIDAIADLEREAVPALMDLSRQVDVVVYAPLFVAAVAAARAVGTRHVSAHFAPIHRASGYGPTGANLGAWANRAAWWLVARMLRRATDAPLNAIVAAAGLPSWRDILLDASHSRLLDLVCVSPSVIAKDPTWGAETRVSGFWFLDEPDFSPDPELEDFVREQAPVVIGFGSMTGLDSAGMTRTLLEAVDGLDRHVVIQSGWAGLGATDLPANVRVAGFVPHAWLFDRAACVVHHGGAGTTGAAMRAGVPQCVVWHLGDQPVWGRMVAMLGLGPSPREHRKLTARWLRGAIERMLSDRAMVDRARLLGAKIRAEDGLGEAVRAIEQACQASP